MKLVASMIVRNEVGRYLEPCILSLLAFCDEIRVVDDGSDDGTLEWLASQDRIHADSERASFFTHEGQARQTLLEWTLRAKPTHVLAIDADEFVTDGQAVRAACEADEGQGAWTLVMEEVWKADDRQLWTRQDGGWRQHPVPVLWRVPSRVTGDWRINDRQLACGREPLAVRRLKPVPTGASILHFGWTCEADRQARYERYVEADGGRFHASAHLRSIMAPDAKVRLARRAWPAGIDREAILRRVRHEAVAA